MITCRNILKNLNRQFDPYADRKDFIRLDRNEDPVGYDEDFFNKCLNSITVHDIAAYADSSALAIKLSSWLDVSVNNLYISAGSDAIIKNIFECYVDPDNQIVLQDPSWRMYDVYACVYGAKVLHVPYDQDLTFNLDEVTKHLQSSTVKMVVLANPNQPTGTVIPKQEIINLLDVAYQTNTIVVIDEAYHLFAESTLVDAIKKYDNLIVARTFSKAFGLAGLRIGYAVANDKRIQELMLLRPVTDANSLALKFSEYLLDNMPVVMNKINDFVAGRNFLYQKFCEYGLVCYPSHGNFLLLRCPSLEDARKIIDEAKKKKYLLKGPFTAYPLENCVRVTVGPLCLMKNFWDDCREIITRYALAHPDSLTLESNYGKNS